MVNILYAVLCLLYTNVHFNVYFVDFMYDKDDNIEIMSTKSHTNSSRPESRNLEDRFVIFILRILFIYYKLLVFNRFDYELDAFNEEQYNIDNYDDDMTSIGGHLMQKFTNNIIHFTD